MTAFGTRRHVLGLVAQNENGALAAASIGLGTWLQRAGYSFELIDLLSQGGGSALAAALARPDIAFAFGHAGVGSRIPGPDNVNIWTATRTPFLCFWYDHPAYNYRQHIVDSSYVLHVYHVADHRKARRFFPEPSGLSADMPMPLGLLADIYKSPWEERRRKFTFAKTGHDPQEILRKWDAYPYKLGALLKSLAAKGLADRNLDLAGATAEAFAQGGHPTGDLDNLFGVMQEVDHYVRAVRSDRLARALLPYPGGIVGRGWAYLPTIPDQKAILYPPFDAGKFIPAIKLFRITVNSNPLWRGGIHERAFYGLAAGNVVLSDRTEAFDARFGHMAGYAGFEWSDDIDEAVARAWEMSADPDGYYYARAPELRRMFEGQEQDTVAHIERLVERVLAHNADLTPGGA